MSSAKKPTTKDPDQLRQQWLERLSDLIGLVEGWARELDWSTRRIEKKMQDSEVGAYKAPALMMQYETLRVLLDPVARATPGTEGVVDLYLMPAYDDIAMLVYSEGGWQLQYVLPESPAAGASRDPELGPLSKETLKRVLAEMKAHAA